MEEKKKINPYIIIIIILVIAVAGLVYDKWGKDIFPSSVESPEGSSSDIDIEIVEGDIQIGNEDASVTIVEYYSYLCGYCKIFDDETKPRIVEDYVSTGKVKFIFRVYPPYELSTAVLCAYEQEKFLEYHNSLFANASNIQAVDDLRTIAEDSGLDGNQFSQCFESQKYLAKAQEWYQQGNDDFERAGVPEDQRGTPAFFVNGELIIGAQPYDEFVEVIERKLAE